MFFLSAFCALVAFEAVVVAGCPPEFSPVSGTCVKVSTKYFESPNAKPYTWDQARQECQSHSDGSWSVDLVQLKSAQTLEDLSHYMATQHSEIFKFIFFAGASETGEGHHWRWLDGEEVDLDSYIWFPAAPSEGVGSQVMTLIPAGHVHNRLYATAYAADTLAPSFVCEAVAGA